MIQIEIFTQEILNSESFNCNVPTVISNDKSNTENAIPSLEEKKYYQITIAFVFVQTIYNFKTFEHKIQKRCNGK